MNWTNNREKQLIKEISDKLVFGKEEKKTSYYISRKEGRVVDSIKEYDYHTPLELQRELTVMWKSFNDDKMEQFVKVCSVATFKNKMKNVEEKKVSTFIYEF